MSEVPVFGICGWKNSGKTTLTCHLVEEFSRRGLKVSTIKHAHHSFEIDQPGTDSFKHRQSGAAEIAIVSRNRWAMIRELNSDPEPSLQDILSRLSPCDLVLIEGYKGEPHPKIETVRLDTALQPPIWQSNTTIVALVTDDPAPNSSLPHFSQNAAGSIADFIEDYLQIGKSNAAE